MAKIKAMLWVGGVSTLMLFINLIEGTPEWFKIVIEIIVILGGGVFCSAIVTLIVDLQNKRQVELVQSRQRKFIMDSAKYKFIMLYKRELTELSVCNTKYLLKKPLKWKRKNLPFKDISTNLLALLQTFEEKITEYTTDFQINSEDLEVEDIIINYITKKNNTCYESLYNELIHIYNDANTYLISGILNESTIEKINFLTSAIQDIITFSAEKYVQYDMVIEFKKILFQKTLEIISIFDIQEDDVFEMHYSI